MKLIITSFFPLHSWRWQLKLSVISFGEFDFNKPSFSLNILSVYCNAVHDPVCGRLGLHTWSDPARDFKAV